MLQNELNTIYTIRVISRSSLYAILYILCSVLFSPWYIYINMIIVVCFAVPFHARMRNETQAGSRNYYGVQIITPIPVIPTCIRAAHYYVYSILQKAEELILVPRVYHNYSTNRLRDEYNSLLSRIDSLAPSSDPCSLAVY